MTTLDPAGRGGCCCSYQGGSTGPETACETRIGCTCSGALLLLAVARVCYCQQPGLEPCTVLFLVAGDTAGSFEFGADAVSGGGSSMHGL